MANYYYVASGQTSSGVVLNDTDFLYVQPGGTAVGTLAANVGVLYVSSGAKDVGAVLYNGGLERVEGSGSYDTVGNSSFLIIADAGIETGALVQSGGNAELEGGTLAGSDIAGIAGSFDDGLMLDDTVLPGGLIDVANGCQGGGLQVLSGGKLLVEGTGAVTGSVVLYGGMLATSSGAAVGQTTVMSGGTLSVVAGAIETDVLVFSGGVLSGVGVQSGSATIYGDEYGLSAGAGAALTVESGGFTQSVDLQSGATEIVLSGGESVIDTVGSGAVLMLASGSEVAGDVVNVGGTIEGAGTIGRLYDFGIVSGVVLGDTAQLFVESAGSATGLQDGGATAGEIFVEPGGYVSGAVLSGSQSEIYVDSGGVASAITLAGGQGASVVVNSSGSVSGVVLSANTFAYISGSAVGDIVSGGVETVESGGVVSATTVASGGRETIVAGGVASGTTVSGGGIEVVNSGGTVSGASILSGGTLLIEAGATVQGAVNGGGGGKLELGGGKGTLTGLLVGGSVTVSGAIPTETFTNFGAVKIDAPANFTAAGDSTVAAGESLVVDGTLTTAGTLTVAGSLTLGGTASGPRALAGTGTLALTGGAASFSTGAKLSIANVTQSGTAAVSVATVALTYAGAWIQAAGAITVGASDTLSFTGSGDSFSGTLGGPGVIRFAGGADMLSGATLSALGTYINGAKVTLSAAITLTKTLTVTSPNLTIASTGASLNGGGTLTLTNFASNEIVGETSSATLTNVNDKVVGAGDIGGGSMTLVNQVGASIIGNSAGVALVIDTGPNAVSNAGLIASEGKGGVIIKSAVANTGALEVTTGTLTVNGAVTGGGGVTIAGGTADFAAAFNQNVDFSGANGVLELAQSQAYTGAITGFSLTGGTSLDLRDISFISSKSKASFVENGAGTSGVLTVTNGAHTAHITLVGDYSNSSFTLGADGHGGTTVVDPHEQAVQPRPAMLAPFIAAMAGFGTGMGGQWSPIPDSGRMNTALFVGHRPA